MADKATELWDLWYPKAAATGLSFARSRIDPADEVLVHAAPEVLTVFIRDTNGNLKAQGQDLQMTEESPITRLRCVGNSVKREDIWPGPEDIGRVVILPGGEAGVLKAWWHADDHSEWRWTVELYNHA